MADLYRLERELQDRFGGPVAGIDEVGRGPLAGPVVAVAVVLPESLPIRGLGDSKALSPTRRDALFVEILETATSVGIGWSTHGAIDRMNILRATHRAMNRAVARLPELPVHLLVDGLPVPGLPRPHTAIVRGDSKCACISAASIVAKVFRDRYMVHLAARYPNYGFDANMGYPTPDHRRALAAWGPCVHHRRSFSPVREALEGSFL